MNLPDEPIITDRDSEAMLPEHNDQYGQLLARKAIDTGENVYQVAVIFDYQHGHGLQLDLRSIWFKYGEPRYGKGVRIDIDNEHAQELLDVAENMIEGVCAQVLEVESA